MSHDVNVVVVQSRQEPISIGLVSVLILAGLTALILNYFWHILALVALVAVGLGIWRAESRTRRREDALRARADYENSLYLAGDPRGVYGHDQGPKP